MAMIILQLRKNTEEIRRYIDASLDYVRMVEHKLTEVIEKLESGDEE